ncbi:hypothetical protein HY642_03345 [Candidatus Woesearchaeota archaeon]|nr:hypothetical protein [Candidatus Woesearchaeota archaeon]
MEEPAIAGDGETSYSEVDTQARTGVRTSGIDLFGKCENEISPAFIVETEQAFTDFPNGKVLLVASGNVEHKLFSAIQSSDVQHTTLKVGTSREIVANASTPYDRLCLGALYHAGGLRDARDGELARQAKRSQVFVNDVVQFYVIFDALLPSSVNAVLQTSPIRFDGGENAGGGWNFDFGSCSNIHTRCTTEQVFKHCAQLSSASEETPEVKSGNSSLQQDCRVSLPHEL